MDKEPCQQNFRLKQTLGQCCLERVDSHPIKDCRKGGAEETEQLVKKWSTEMRTDMKVKAKCIF